MNLAVPRRLAGIAAAGLLVATAAPFGVTQAAAAPPSGAITLSVTSITPQTPSRSFPLQPLTISLSLQNNSAVAIDNVTITAVRATPIIDQRSLDQAIAHPATPDQSLLQPITPTHPLEFDAPADQTVSELFQTTTSRDTTANPGLCLCTDAIYPIYITATATVGGVTKTLATTQTYLPAFGNTAAPVPLKIGWLWPLLDVPHRLTSTSVFLDDDLATEVAAGGRLDRALTVLEEVANKVPMTVITDPNLIDELRVMAAGPYRVAAQGATPVAGVGTLAAATWLQRLTALLTANPTTEIAYTPFGDPDVQSLASNRLPWTAGLSASAQAQDSAVLGGLTPQTDIAWPNGETASADTVDALAARGMTAVVLNDKTLTGGASAVPPPTALAKLKTPAGKVTAAVTSATVNNWAAKVLSTSGPGKTAIPQLVSQVALRSVEDVTQSRYLLIAPPRDVDTDPDVAKAAILATSTAFWSSPMPLRQATGTEATAGHGVVKLAKVAGVSDASIDALRYVAHALPKLGSMFTSTDRAQQVGFFPQAMQLAASSSLSSEPSVGTGYATQLSKQVVAIRGAVQLVVPRKNSSYTLTSSNSPLPVSITNRLTVPVRVDIDCASVNGLLGFSADPVRSHLIGPGQTVQVPVRTHFDRTGSIEVQVTLSTPNGLTLGRPIQVSVRSTALGTIGVVITTVAAVVLVLALLIRVIGRLRAREPRTTQP